VNGVDEVTGSLLKEVAVHEVRGFRSAHHRNNRNDRTRVSVLSGCPAWVYGPADVINLASVLFHLALLVPPASRCSSFSSTARPLVAPAARPTLLLLLHRPPRYSCRSSACPPRYSYRCSARPSRCSCRYFAAHARCSCSATRPGQTTPTGAASTRRSVRPWCECPLGSLAATAAATQCRRRRRPHRNMMHVASSHFKGFRYFRGML
jgi:hypothetical protein